MARKPSKTLTEGELRIMSEIWRLTDQARPAVAVKEVTEALSSRVGLAYNTVQTMMGILVQKGYLSREKDGRAFAYAPTVSRRQARTEALKHLVGTFFGGSNRELLHNLIEDESIDAGEMEELRSMLASSSDATADVDGTRGPANQEANGHKAANGHKVEGDDQ